MWFQISKEAACQVALAILAVTKSIHFIAKFGNSFNSLLAENILICLHCLLAPIEVRSLSICSTRYTMVAFTGTKKIVTLVG